MKILHISPYTWDTGGPPKVIFDHACRQLEFGAEVTILTPFSNGQTLYPAPEGAKIITYSRHWFARFWTDFSPEIYHWLKKHGSEYDVIHLHGLWHFAGVAPYLAGVKTPKCMTIHGYLDAWALANGYWKKQIFSWLFQKNILKKTQLIHVFNTEELSDVQKYLGFHHPNIQVIPNGMNVDDFVQLPPRNRFRFKHTIPENQQIILFLSRINYKKGLDLLLPAFQEISQQRSDCMLILAGSDDGYLADTERFIQENKLENRIKWVGMLKGDDKLEALADADIFALPSYSEGFSIATLEALVSGIPSLLSDRVGFGDAIRETQAAHLVELRVDSVKAGLIRLLDDPSYAQQLAANGKNLVKTRYDIKLVAKQLYAAYEEVVLHE